MQFIGPVDSRLILSCIFLVGLAVTPAGCAGHRTVAKESTPATLQLPPEPGSRGEVTINRDTRSLDLNVTISGAAPQTLKPLLRIDPKLLATSEEPSVEARLTGLPITLRARKLHDELWELDLPRNVVELLSKNPGRASYTGSLVLDSSGQGIPLILRLHTPEKKPGRSRSSHVERRSAG